MSDFSYNACKFEKSTSNVSHQNLSSFFKKRKNFEFCREYKNAVEGTCTVSCGSCREAGKDKSRTEFKKESQIQNRVRTSKHPCLKVLLQVIPNSSSS